MDLGLRNKAVLVTAASQGLGRATAESFAREGARVALCARDASALEAAAAAAREAGAAEVLSVPCDLTDPLAIDAMVARAIEAFGTLHVLVNNAGGPPPGRFHQLDDAAWQKAFELTLMSAVRATRAALPVMRAQRWGRIVNISSYTVKQPIPDIMLSNSLRLAVAGWAKSLATDIARDNVLINTVGPGWTRTGRVTQLMASRATGGRTPLDAEADLVAAVPLGRLAEPREIADVVTFLASERASFVTGTFLAVDGGVVQGPT